MHLPLRRRSEVSEEEMMNLTLCFIEAFPQLTAYASFMFVYICICIKIIILHGSLDYFKVK